MKLFRPISWYEGIAAQPLGECVSHLLMELGRLGMEIRDIESHSRPPNTETVLSDLLDWLSNHPGETFGRLVNWQALDLSQMRSRVERERFAKPRIEVSAHITKMNNLSVRWHPGGWRDTELDWHRTDRNHFNLITQRKWNRPPDFHWFTGDEEPTFNSRSSNELMYIRGVGNLRPEPRDDYGPYATYNSDVVDSILICAVRSAYESLIRQLEYSFEVEVVDAFDFVTRDEIKESDPHSDCLPIHRVIAWSLGDAAEIRARRELEAAAEQAKRDHAELASITETYGFTPEAFVTALLHASSTKATGPSPSGEHTDRNVAKELRNAGFKVDARNVRRIRQLIERYNPDILPEILKPEPLIAEAVTSPISNVVRLKSSENDPA